ncbi:MAG TPA: DNA repair exonuclease [archaeon]|nr:DNA repair exonuclease [archaeon]
MLVGIFSDTHLGFGSDERSEETFSRFKEAIELFKEKKVDFILHAGDLFDSATPTQEVWLSTFDCFAKNNGSIKELKKNTRTGEKNVFVKGVPIIAIHGTHEHRGKDFANALDVLEESNALVHLHVGNIVFEKEINGVKEKVVVHGMGGVPEKHAKEVLSLYDPKPISSAINIILFHQSFKEFLPFDDDMVASLSLADLPDGFDLIINGHLHWVDEQVIEGKRFLLTGSSVFTQMKNLESKKEKGVFFFDTLTKKLDFVPYKVQRKLFYEKINFDNSTPEEINSVVEEKINSFLSSDFEMKPLIRLKIVGSLAKGFSQSDVKFSLPEEKAIFSISKELVVEDFKKKMLELKEMQNQKKGVLDLGLTILEKNVEEANLKNFDTSRMFELLSSGDTETAQKVLLSEKA